MTSLVVRLLISWVALAPAVCFADMVVEWNFEDTTTPDVGTGSVQLLGGVTGDYDFGPFGGGNRALFTTGYAIQQTQSGERGIEFRVNTTGFQDIQIGWGMRSSGDSSKWIRLDYTNDGSSWQEVELFEIGDTSANTFSFIGRDLSTLTAANNNPEFGLRFVSVFSPNAFTENAVDYGANSAYQQVDSLAAGYSPAGTLAFDNFTVSGITAVPEPSTALLVGFVVTAVCAQRLFRVRLKRNLGKP